MSPTTKVVPLRGLRGAVAATGLRASIEDLMLAHVVATLRQHPWLNGRIEDKEIRLESRIHLAVDWVPHSDIEP